LQYTSEAGFVRIGVKGWQKELKSVIENSGPGIGPGDLPFVFERFYRGEKSRSREYGGTGIGLTIVNELVEAHGGRVGVESTHAKTLFWFTLRAG
jgi:two-component system, OmpR family, sensor histidine kinase BaeS